jgi:serine protease Do
MAAIRVASIGNSESLKLGDQVVVIGNALGYGQSVTSGYVSALDRTLQLSDGTNTFTSDDMIQTDAAINAGNSGGALLNMKGELVGINEAKSSYSSSGVTVDNVGYAIPMEKAKPILDNLMNQKTRDLVDEDSRGYLGASLTDVTSDYADFYHMPQGVCITQVINGGPADKCGLRRGDVITALDGASVMTFSELSDKLDYYAAGETVTITYQRSVGGHYEEQQAKAVLVSENDINQLKK